MAALFANINLNLNLKKITTIAEEVFFYKYTFKLNLRQKKKESTNHDLMN